MRIVVTGAAGFVGFHVAARLLREGHVVYGVDNLNDYYDVQLKRDRLKQLEGQSGFAFSRMGLEDAGAFDMLMREEKPDVVVHLAAQAGVRYSLENPRAYIDANIVGFLNVLEACRHYPVNQLIYASSSSVYGANRRMPFSEEDAVNHQVSLYGATKKSNELMAHTYSHLYGIPVTGLRFFTVYGPWGRPDMAYYSFTRRIVEGSPIQVYNYGRMKRDFTYVDDVVEGIVRLLETPPRPDAEWDAMHPSAAGSDAPYRIYNIGHHEPVELMAFIETLERHIGKKAVVELLPMQAGDVLETYADIGKLQKDTGYAPTTSIDEGLGRFVAWYREYYGEQE